MTDITNLSGIWPEWQLEKELGRGSFGVVYKAVRLDHNIRSYSAIKVITIPSDGSSIDSLRSEGLDMNATRTYLQGIVNDFVGEIQIMESFKGMQNIVSVEDYKVVERTDQIGWNIYIRMELLTPFNQFICDRKLSEPEVIKLGCDICTALEICQKRNIIHRDIKPENIFVNDFGDFKLGDFGIARKMENVTGGLSQKGTFNYMAPEVAGNGHYDGRADIYSLGIVLYRLFNQNRLPFLDTQKQLLSPNERRAAVERRLRGEPLPAPCEASPEMAALILTACAYNPNKRFLNPTAMKRALLNAGNSRGGQGGQSVNQTFVQGAGTGFSRASQERGYSQERGASQERSASQGQNPNFMEQTVRVRRAPQSQMPQNQNQGGGFSQPPAPEKKKRWWLALLLVLLSAAVIGGGIFAAVMLTRNNDNADTPDASAQTGENTGGTFSDTPSSQSNGEAFAESPFADDAGESMPQTQPESAMETMTEGRESENTSASSDSPQAGAYSDIVKTYTGTYQKSETKVLGMDVEITSCNENGNINAVIIAYGLEGTDTDTFVKCAMTGQTAGVSEDGSLKLLLSFERWIVEAYGFDDDFESLTLEINPERSKLVSQNREIYCVDASADNMYSYADIVRTYQGTYVPNWGVTDMELTILACDPKTGRISAEFYFYPDEHNPDVASGKYSMMGQVLRENPDGSITLALVGQDWIDEPENVKMIDFYLTISPDRMLATSDQYQIYLTAQ